MAQTGYSKIQIYSSSTATHTPSAGNLTNDTSGSELAINITDGKLFYKDNSGTVQVLATKGSGVVGGSNTQVQYNSSGTFAGSANLTFDGTTLTSLGFSGPLNGTVGATTANTGAFTTLGASGAVTLSGGTANGVAYLNGSKVLTTGSALVFDGTNFGLGVTPSAWISTAKAFQINGGYVGSIWTTASGQFQIGNNVYTNSGSNDTYISTNYAAKYNISSTGQHQWYNAPSGTAGNAITFTQAMTLDVNGGLLVGNTSNPGNNYRLLVATGGYFGLGVTTSNTVYMSSLGTGLVYSNLGVLTSTNPSDERLKENITDLGWGLQQILALRPVSYTWKTDAINQGKQYGFIAQEVQPVMSDLVKTFKGQDENEYFGLDKEGIYATTVKAIQELAAQVTTLQTQVTALKG